MDHSSWAYATTFAKPGCTFVFTLGWKRLVRVSAEQLRAHALNPEAFFGQPRGNDESDAAVLLEGFQSCAVHRRLSTTGVAMMHERQRHHLLTAAGFGFVHTPSNPSAQVRCIAPHCSETLACGGLIDMVVHVSRNDHRFLRSIGIRDGELRNWAYARAAEGNTEQRAMSPSGQQRVREMLLVPPALHQARKAELKASADQAALREAARSKRKTLQASSTALVPDGRCSWREENCAKGPWRAKEEWTAEVIADVSARAPSSVSAETWRARDPDAHIPR